MPGMPQQQMQGQGQGQGQPEGGDAQSSIQKTIGLVGQGLGMLSDLFAKTPDLPPEAKDAMNTAFEAFKGAVEILNGASNSSSSRSAPGTVTPEQGGARSAVPSGPMSR